MSAENVYTSIACNRTPQSADWGENGQVIFAACNSVAVFEPNSNGSVKIQKTFVEHTAKVNTVKWISNHEFLSGAYDKFCILWNIKDQNAPKIWKLIGHEDGVTFVDAIRVNDQWLIATTSLDSTIKFWSFSIENDAYEVFYTIKLGSGFCFALKFAILPNSKDKVLLAYSTDNHNIHLTCEQIVDGKREFVKVDTLVGHENWVRGLDIVKLNNTELLLASSSQDTFIRLWRISARQTIEPIQIRKKANIFATNEDIQIEEKIFTVKTSGGKSLSYAVTLESVLLGHDNWVYSVHWSKTFDNRLQLLSSSIDKTLIIWAMQEDGVWMEKVRVGEVGGNTLGFYGGKFSPDAKSIIGHGYQGSFHIWHQSENENIWIPGINVGGHFSEVRDLCWNPTGEFLLTVSADQTTRCHAPWKRADTTDNLTTWHEIARPQVHGYDMQAICLLERFKFASGAEEKIVRTFQAPVNFIENLKRLCNIESSELDEIIESTPKGASVPSLGLSNKAVFDESIPVAADERHIKDQYPDNYFVPISMTSPPTEETLMQNTLWPEVQKLYGHGYEIFALSATSDGKILASSCRATNDEHAQIILWDTSTWKQIQKLPSHQLTVTQLKFAPNNKWLLSVSRDRRWTLFENDTATDALCNFKLIATTDKKNGIHSRIIWTCDWTHDSKHFATGSRDGKVVAWQQNDNDSGCSLKNYGALSTLELAKNESVTAIAFASCFAPNNCDYVAAIGLESGSIHICTLNTSWTILFTIDQVNAHHLTVKRLQFRPSANNPYQLASCGSDHLTRIYQIKLNC
ncbi:probable elongator complex protein 2 [Contarinia nasturtii]|uniref:probable elongator complex protein 2 n=1 Tax=Contarinia nasturtii TaxID=265458 RepID=UPI0012D454F7|nr:probable elongator complex protein 2 [Contarinia nasturtii]